SHEWIFLCTKSFAVYLRAHDGGVNGIGLSCFRDVNRILFPIVFMSATGCPSDSFHCDTASLPCMYSAPALTARVPSPVQSAKYFASMSYISSVAVQIALIFLTSPPDASDS